MIRLVILFSCSLILMCVTLYILFTVPMHGARVYDCRMADFHPDYPPAVKEECRKLNAKEIKGVST